MSLPWRLALERRLELPRWLHWLSPVISVALALLVGALFLFLAGVDPLEVYRHILGAGFLGRYALSDTAVKATPLILCGVGVAIAFRARLWNIGAEGQLLLGAWAATGVALYLLPPSTPRPLMLLAMMAAGFLAGAIWGAVPGLLKARLGTSEIITTLMLNYVAVQWINYFVFVPWSERGFQLTPQLPRSAWLPRLADTGVAAFSGLTAHLGLVVAVLAAALFAVVLARTRFGFELRVVGDNPLAARAAGMSLPRTISLVMLLSGGLAGLAGTCEVAGVVHRLQDRFSPGYGFTAIIVAWLARLSPGAVVLVAFLFGGLLVGGKEIQPAGIPQMLQGIILFVVVSAETLLRYRVRLLRRTTAASAGPRADAAASAP
jgi:general nucleoside transport system permease protein